MQKLGHLLASSPLGHENQEVIRAAAITSAATKIIQQTLNLNSDEAAAVIYKHHEIIIKVSHGAISGQINIQQKKLLEAINQAVVKLYPNNKYPIEKLISRQY